jgi:hypothetical protein
MLTIMYNIIQYTTYHFNFSAFTVKLITIKNAQINFLKYYKVQNRFVEKILKDISFFLNTIYKENKRY